MSHLKVMFYNLNPCISLTVNMEKFCVKNSGIFLHVTKSVSMYNASQ